MDDEPESRGLYRGRLSYDHIFRLEPVVPVEWYSRAQLEYLAEKIRNSQIIQSLLLPIPKLAMFQNVSRSSSTSVEVQDTNRNETTPPLRSEPETQTDNFVYEDLSCPLQIVSSPLTSNSEADYRAGEEMEDVAFCIENIVSIVTAKEDNRSQECAPAPFVKILGNARDSHPDVEASAKSYGNDSDGTSKAGEQSGDNAVCLPDRSPEKDQQQQAFPSSSDRTEETATHKPNPVDYEETEESCEELAREPKPQRFLREKKPLVQGAPAMDTVIRLHEPDALADHPTKLQPMIRRISERLVVIVPAGNKTLLRDFHHPSTLDENFKLEKLQSAQIEEIISKINVESRQRSPHEVAEDEPRVDSPIDQAGEPVATEEPIDEDEDVMQWKRELFDLLYDEIYEDIPLSEMMEGAYATLLLEESAEVKLLNKKKHLIELQKGLTLELAKLQKSHASSQRRVKRARNLEHSLAKKRKLVETRGAQPVMQTRVLAAAPKYVKTIDESVNMHNMALAPGTLLRVVQGKLDGNPAHAPRFTVVPQATRAGPSHLDPQAASPLRKTVNVSFSPTIARNPNQDHLRSQASDVHGLRQNVASAPADLAPTVISVASNPNLPPHLFANHPRFYKIDPRVVSPNTRMPPVSSAASVHIGFPHGMVRPGRVGNVIDPSLANGHSQPQQLIQVPSYAFPVSKPSVITRPASSRVVMVTPAQFSALQSQVHQRRPIRIQQASMVGEGQYGPTTVVHHLQRYPEELATIPHGAAPHLKPHAVAPPTFTEHRVPNLHSNDQTVIVNPSLNFQVVRPQSPMAARFYTVKQAYVTRPSGPLN